MTLNEVINYLDENAHDDREVTQLSDWLRELKQARRKIDLLEILRDGFKADAQVYRDENVKLRELINDM